MYRFFCAENARLPCGLTLAENEVPSYTHAVAENATVRAKATADFLLQHPELPTAAYSNVL